MKKTLRADCNQAGTLILNASTPGGGWLKEYEFDTPEALQRKAATYNWVERPNGKEIKGANYTLRMAQNDFNSITTNN